MLTTNKNVNFQEFSLIVNSNLNEYEMKLKQCCVKSSIIPISEFYDGFQREIAKINSEITPSKDHQFISDFAEIFKEFEVYPSNLQRPKKTFKEINRMNSTLIRGVQQNKDSSSSSINLSKINFEEIRSASEILHDFSKFKTKSASFKEDAHLESLSQEYQNQLNQLDVFAKELDKLLPSNKLGSPALTPIEERKIYQAVQLMEDFIFIQENQGIYNILPVDGNSLSFKELMEIITYGLVAVSCFKP